MPQHVRLPHLNRRQQAARLVPQRPRDVLGRDRRLGRNLAAEVGPGRVDGNVEGVVRTADGRSVEEIEAHHFGS